MDAPDPESRLKTLAVRRCPDYQRVRPGSAFADPELSLSLDEAYAVQMELALRCAAGDAVAGYKADALAQAWSSNSA